MSPIHPREPDHYEEAMHTAITAGELALALGFLFFISRSLLERMQELGVFPGGPVGQRRSSAGPLKPSPKS